MPSNVFDRAMFKAENKPMKADSGIMQGFDDEGEVPEDEMMEEVSQRKPNSPEILMNNLRGDMRSVDARYQELADMVGEDVAMETPPEVLALLQAQLAQQSMGIGALPPDQGLSPPPMAAGAPPMPTPDMMGGMPQPGAMPQGPEGQMPQGFALGGLATRMATAIAQRSQNQSGGDPVSGFAGMSGGVGGLIEKLRAQGAFGAIPSVASPAQYAGPVVPAQLITENGRATTNPEWLKKFVADFQTGQQPRQFNEGGIANFSEGVAQAGRNGDTVLAHITPEQHQYLTELGGGATVNPETGLPEHFMGQQMLANLGQRAMPYLQEGARTLSNVGQQANVLAGRALYNPTFSAPVLNQARDASGRFGAMSVDGMNAYYPTLTQGIANSRVGQMVAQKASQGANYVANMPGTTKAMAALMAIPGASVISNSMGGGGGGTTPNMPSSDVPGAIVTDDKGGRSYVMPEAPVDEAPQSTPIDYNNLPVAPGAKPDAEAEKNQRFIQENIKPKTRGERLEEYMEENVPIFERYLGTDKNYNQAQALFVLADLGLKFASTRKPGESFASAFARSAQGVPAGLSTIAAAEDQAKRQVKSAALTSGLQTLAAQDKAAADIQREIAKKVSAGQKMTYKDVGAGMSRVTDNNGKLIGYEVQQSVKDEFLNDPIVPLRRVDEKNFATTNPYAKATPRPAAAVQTESLRGRIESEQISARDMVNLIDNTISDIASVYGPGAWATDFKNNILVPVTPNLLASPDTDFEGKRSRVALTLKEITTALAKSGDSGNIAVSERALAKGLTGKDPAAFFADPELVMKNMMAIRTQLVNNYYRKSAQLGHTDYDIKMDIPNLGTVNDPFPQDKLPYLRELAKTNPNGQVFVKYGKTVEPVFLNTLK